MGDLIKQGCLGDVLFKARIVTEAELKAALDEQHRVGCRVGEALVRLGAVTQEDIDWALSHQLDIPYVRLKPELIDPAALALVPAVLARRYHLVPLVLVGDELSVALADPLDQEALQAIAQETGCRVNVAVALMREILEMLELCYGETARGNLGFSSPLFSAQALEAANRDLSCATLLNYLLLHALRRKYSQISLQPVAESVLVLAREQGRTRELGRLPVTQYPPLLARIRRLARLARADELSEDGGISFLWRGRRVNFQVLILRGELITVKLQIPFPPLTQLSHLQLGYRQEEELKGLAAGPEGVVLVAAQDAELRGRSLDLLLDLTHTDEKTVLLLGERIGRGATRFPLVPAARDGVDQTRQVIGAALEHDPDLLVLEEVADANLLAACKAVLRGKRVIAGTPFTDTASLMQHLIRLLADGRLVPGVVQGLFCVKSVLLLCPQCKREYRLSPEEEQLLKLPRLPARTFRPGGCQACDYTGYRGRRYLVDLVRFDTGREEALRHLESGARALDYLREQGHRGIVEEGADLLGSGEISPGEYLATIVLPG